MLQCLFLLRMMHVAAVVEIQPGIPFLPMMIDFIAGEQVIQGHSPCEVRVLNITSYLEELVAKRRSIDMGTYIARIAEERLYKSVIITILVCKGFIGGLRCRIPLTARRLSS